MIGALVLAPNTVQAQGGGDSDLKVVTVEGVAGAANNMRARDDAIQDAMRRAVEQGAGVFVDAATMTENFEMIADAVLTKAAGYVRSYDILSEGEQNGLYRVRMRCEVKLGPIKDDLLALRILQQQRGLPRVVVFGDEKIMGEPAFGRLVATEIEDYLTSQGMKLVAGDFFEDLKARDAVLAENVYEDFSQAVALASRHNAEVVVVYLANAEHQGTRKAWGGGSEWHVAEPSMRVRIIGVDNARLISSFSWDLERNLPKGRSAEAACRKALEELGYSVAEEVYDAIVSNWETGGFSLELVVTGADYNYISGLKADIEEMRGVSSVGQVELTGQTAVVRLEANFSGTGLADRLISEFGDELQVEEITESRLKVRLNDGRGRRGRR
jgi:hypothetical protein